MKIGLVLSGGGGKGAYQIGAWKAFQQFGIEFDIITGTSIGAINGLLMRTIDYEQAKEMWLSMEENMASDDNTGKLELNEEKLYLIDRAFKEPECLKDLIKYHGAMDTTKLREGLCKLLENKSITKDLYICSVAAVDEPFPEYFNVKNMERQQIADTILSSASIPLIFDPVQMNGKYYYDGGLMDNTPVKPAIDQGCDLLFVVLLKAKDINHLNIYTDTPIIPIIPSCFLGDFKTGTMNFTQKEVSWKIELGYKDTIKMLSGLKAIR